MSMSMSMSRAMALSQNQTLIIANSPDQLLKALFSKFSTFCMIKEEVSNGYEVVTVYILIGNHTFSLLKWFLLYCYY